jgi:hypothetical protein
MLHTFLAIYSSIVISIHFYISFSHIAIHISISSLQKNKKNLYPSLAKHKINSISLHPLLRNTGAGGADKQKQESNKKV